MKKREEKIQSKCEHRIGTVTMLEPHGMIDQRYYFEVTDVEQKNIKVGQAVRYLAYRADENKEWTVRQISIIESDEWSGEGAEQPVSRVTG